MGGCNVSHSKRHTKRTFDVNLFHKKFYWVEQDCWISLNVSAAGLKTINKMGLDAALKQAAEKGYLYKELGGDYNGKEKQRSARSGYPRMHRNEGQRSAGNVSLRDDEEPQEHS